MEERLKLQKKREFGELQSIKSKTLSSQKLFRSNRTVWMSHEDAVIKLPKKF